MDSFPQFTHDRREYSLKVWHKILHLLAGMVFLTLGVVFGPVLFRSSGSGLTAPLPALFLLGFGIYMLAQVARSRLVVDGTRIEVRGAFREQSADLGDIEGYRTIQTRYGSYTQLQLKPSLGNISIPNSFDTDDIYLAWLHRLTNLDERDRDDILAEVAQQAELGSTPEQRLQALPTARTRGVFLSIVTGVAAAALFFAPVELRIPSALLLVTTPLVAALLLHRAPLLYAIFKQKADPRAELLFVPLIAGFGLLLPARGVHFVSNQQLMSVAAPIALAYFAAYATAGRMGASRPGSWLGLLLFVALYGYSLAAVADTLTDHGQASTYSAQVLGKHISSGRYRSYRLNIAPWGPMEEPSRVGVSSTTYNAVMPGDEVCIQLHSGSLHIPWYRVADCRTRFPEDAQR